MWVSVILLIIFFNGFGEANVAPEEVFAENGGRRSGYPSEEDTLEYIINRDYGMNNWQEYNGDVDTEKNELDGVSTGKEMEIENEKQGHEKSIRKRKGQEEFATFVDPSKILAHSNGHQRFYEGGYEKRAPIDISSGVSGDNAGDTAFIATTTVCTAAAVFGMIAAAFVWRRVHKKRMASQECEYPNYGVTGPAKERSGSTSPVSAMDAKLASSAHLYHYQHTKQQIIAMEQSTCEGKGRDTDDSEGEEDEGDFSVYEYPGLAPTGDIEVANPLFENATSPLTKTDPKAASLQPRIHQQ